MAPSQSLRVKLRLQLFRIPLHLLNHSTSSCLAAPQGDCSRQHPRRAGWSLAQPEVFDAASTTHLGGEVVITSKQRGQSTLKDGVMLPSPYADLRHHHPRRHPAGNNQERSPSWHMEGEVRRTTRSREKNKILHEEGLQHSGCKSTAGGRAQLITLLSITAP